ncbi:single-stranded DNA-binding protein [Plantactinospora sp. CA-294935]|uniref:single-stranded DNA-binding protein n=1 Tax=Plantactinospora sp. CA-294935 TaxID=3240012 RepID=UPI003D8FDE8F
MNETTITVVGNLTDDPEIRYTPSGAAVCKFRVASTPRFYDKTTQQWKDGDPLFLACQWWREPAENAAQSLQRGMRVIVQGRLRQRSYETREGEKRTVYELEIDEVGPSLRYATARVEKMTRSSGGSSGQRTASPPAGGSTDDPWATAAPAQSRTATAVLGRPDGNGVEPPF